MPRVVTGSGAPFGSWNFRLLPVATIVTGALCSVPNWLRVCKFRDQGENRQGTPIHANSRPSMFVGMGVTCVQHGLRGAMKSENGRGRFVIPFLVLVTVYCVGASPRCLSTWDDVHNQKRPSSHRTLRHHAACQHGAMFPRYRLLSRKHRPTRTSRAVTGERVFGKPGLVVNMARRGQAPPWPQSSFPVLRRQGWNRTNTGMNCWYVQAKFSSRRGLRQQAESAEANPHREITVVAKAAIWPPGWLRRAGDAGRRQRFRAGICDSGHVLPEPDVQGT